MTRVGRRAAAMLGFKPRAKPEERRRTERHTARGMAKILGGAGSLARECWISDISDGGARLHAEADVPDDFALVGELGLLSPEQKRTQTLECREDGRLLAISYDQLKQLFVQNPQFGFFFLRLTTARLFANLAYLEAEVERLKG